MTSKIKELLEFKIEGQSFKTEDQYKTGLQLKQLAGIPEDTDLYLQIKEPWADEPIENSTKVNLARPEIEHFFVKKKLHFTINKEQFISYKQFIRGSEIRELGKISSHDEIYLDIEEGWQDDFIQDEEIVDLARPGKENFFSKKKEDKLVAIRINNIERKVLPGIYKVTELKKIGGVSASHELEQKINDKLTPLDDNSSVDIKGCEEFFSHVRDGSSS